MTGALIGTSAGILLLHRKLRPPITATELAALRTTLETKEASLAEATANVKDLRAQVAAREQTIQQDSEALKEKQKQLDLTSAGLQKEAAERSAAEQQIKELTTQTATLTVECGKLEAKLKDESRLLGEKTTLLASLEPQLEAGRKVVEELTGQVSRLAAESAALRSSLEQECGRREFLEAQSSADQKRMKMLTAELAEMQTERQRFEIRLQEERQSARKGMELLLMAQEKLSHMFSAASENSQNGNGHGPHEVVATKVTPKPVETATELSEDEDKKTAAEGEVVTINKVRQAS
jgi:chromosome segregation ATPase